MEYELLLLKPASSYKNVDAVKQWQSRVLRPAWHIIGQFGDESFHTFLHEDWTSKNEVNNRQTANTQLILQGAQLSETYEK